MTWRWFTREEFACKCGCGTNEISDVFVTKLDALREELGFPLPVNSGYRCPDHNDAVSSTGRAGPHTTGQAVDLRVDRKRAFQVVTRASFYGFTGMGLKQKGNGRFIHLDTLPNADGQPRPTVWTY